MWKRVPQLFDTVQLLKAKDYLPAIWFIFSRANCDKAAQQVHSSGAHLTSTEEQAAIYDMVAALRCFSTLALSVCCKTLLPVSAKCDKAVQQVHLSGTQLTSTEEQDAISAIGVGPQLLLYVYSVCMLHVCHAEFRQ